MVLSESPRIAASGKRFSRVAARDWGAVSDEIDKRGFALLQQLLTDKQCQALRALYSQPELFRKKIILQQHGYGQGEYQYFTYPLPGLIAELRSALYPQLVPIANAWYQQLNLDTQFPDTLGDFLDRCHRAGQNRPTPLLLKYGKGDYNCLHQDLYGEHVFPLQVAILLSRPGHDFTGGEFVLTEQRPRMQSRAEVVDLSQGDAVVFAVNHRPKAGKRGYYRVNMRHGVSTLRSGIRLTAGIIFHDAH